MMMQFKMRAISGGWSNIDIATPPIPEITTWAVTEHFKDNMPLNYFPIYAQQQVVAGMNYKIWINVVINNHHYQVWEFVIYDHMGTKSITSAKQLIP